MELRVLTRRDCDFRNRSGCGAPPGGCNGTPGSGITCWTGRFGFSANFFKQATRFSHINDTSSIRCSTYKYGEKYDIVFRYGKFLSLNLIRHFSLLKLHLKDSYLDGISGKLIRFFQEIISFRVFRLFLVLNIKLHHFKFIQLISNGNNSNYMVNKLWITSCDQHKKWHIITSRWIDAYHD